MFITCHAMDGLSGKIWISISICEENYFKVAIFPYITFNVEKT